MAVRNKIFIPNEIYFITFTILGWKKIFISRKYCDLVYKWFDCLKEYGNKIHGYVIMPNHIHCLLFVAEKSPKPPKLVFNGKRFMAYGIVRLLKEDDNTARLNYFKVRATKKDAKHKIFEPRYDSLIIQTEKFFLEKINYIHGNPCQEKWKLAENPEDYIYSSASNYIMGKGIYDVDVMEI